MKETWKDVQGYDGRYRASTLGRVRTTNYKGTGKTIELNQQTNTHGYLFVRLHKGVEPKSYEVHQLIAIVFLNHKPMGRKIVINHIDLNKKNNNVKNLEIVTARRNSNQLHMKSSSEYVGVSFHKGSKKWIANICIDGERNRLGSFDNEIEASNAYQNELLKLKEPDPVRYIEPSQDNSEVV